MLSVNFDTVVVQVLANPQLTQLSLGNREEADVSQDEGGEVPNTAHALLREGSLECLALGRRGLFAAGKVSGADPLPRPWAQICISLLYPCSRMV